MYLLLSLINYSIKLCLLVMKNLLVRTTHSLLTDGMLVVYVKWSSMGFADGFIMKTASIVQTSAQSAKLPWIRRTMISWSMVFLPSHFPWDHTIASRDCKEVKIWVYSTDFTATWSGRTCHFSVTSSSSSFRGTEKNSPCSPYIKEWSCKEAIGGESINS